MIFENLKLDYFYQTFSPFKESEVSNIINLISNSRVGKFIRFKCYGNAYFNEEDSRWEHLWPWIVKNDFNGNESAAMDAYTAWVKERWN